MSRIALAVLAVLAVVAASEEVGTCQENLCHRCTPSSTGSGAGTCCDSTWSCVWDGVFDEYLCLPPHPWICSSQAPPAVEQAPPAKKASPLKLGAAGADGLPVYGDMRMTPFGLFHKDCVFTHPEGAIIETRADGTKVTYPDGSTHHIPRNSTCDETWIPTERLHTLHHMSPAITPISGWYQYTYENQNPGTFNYFSSNYDVPKSPGTDENNLLYYFIGFENLSTSPLTILQPVLTWYQGAWTMSSWNCCPNGQTHQAGPLTNLPTDGSLFGSVKSGSGVDVITSSYPGASPVVLQVANDAGQGDRVWDWVDATLEVYSVDTCDELSPTGMTFTNLKFGKKTGSSFSPLPLSWEISSKNAGCGYGVDVKANGDVEIGPK